MVTGYYNHKYLTYKKIKCFSYWLFYSVHSVDMKKIFLRFYFIKNRNYAHFTMLIFYVYFFMIHSNNNFMFLCIFIFLYFINTSLYK